MNSPTPAVTTYLNTTPLTVYSVLFIGLDGKLANAIITP
jgi:hypothetical protein